MARWKIQHTEIKYAGLSILAPGTHSLEETEAEISWNYNTETVDIIDRRRALLVDRGNAYGELSLTTCQDYPSYRAALEAWQAVQKHVDAHPSGTLSIALHDEQSQDDGVLTQAYKTGVGSDNYNLYGADIYLDSKVEITALSLAWRASGYVDETPIYLRIEVQNSRGEWQALVTSAKAVAPQLNAPITWELPRTDLPAGVFRITASADSSFAELARLGLRVFADTGNNGRVYGTQDLGGSGAAYIPELTIYTRQKTDTSYTAAVTSIKHKLQPIHTGYRLSASWDFIIT